jgi:hypothetical protein
MAHLPGCCFSEDTTLPGAAPHVDGSDDAFSGLNRFEGARRIVTEPDLVAAIVAFDDERWYEGDRRCRCGAGVCGYHAAALRASRSAIFCSI